MFTQPVGVTFTRSSLGAQGESAPRFDCSRAIPCTLYSLWETIDATIAKKITLD